MPLRAPCLLLRSAFRASSHRLAGSVHTLNRLAPAAAARCSKRIAAGAAAAAAASAAATAAAAHLLASCDASSAARRFEDDYELGEQLGEGNYGIVRKGVCRRTGKAVAIKIIPRDKQSEESIRHEVEVLRKVEIHRSIAKLEDFYESDGHFYIVMEFVAGKEVFEYLVEAGAFTEKKAARLYAQVAEAVALLHAQDTCHADIKPENLLLTKEGHVRLIDFGLSCELRHLDDPDSISSKGLGTWSYWPPEAFHVPRQMGLKADMWALGVVLFVMLAGYHPFDGQGEADDRTTKRNICTAEPDFTHEVWGKVSKQGKALVKGLLRKDPQERLTIEHLLQHPWLASGGAPDKPLRQAGVLRRQPSSAKLTASLRAAGFATILQQQGMAAQVDAAQREVHAARLEERSSKAAQLRRRNSIRAPMLEAEILHQAFRAFDVDAKGYITEADLRRVLGGQGRPEASASELHGMLEAGAEHDRKGERVTYGSFVRLMGRTTKVLVREGEWVMREGDAVRDFYGLLSGQVDVVRTRKGQPDQVLNTIRATESCYFGETALLEGRERRSVGIRCSAREGCQVLKLSKEDFELGFLQGRAAEGEAAEARRRARVLGFMQMVSPNQLLTLQRGDALYRRGDAADRLFILRHGTLRVQQHEGGATLGEVQQGECVGEQSLIAGRAARSKVVSCASERCELVSILGADFLRLMEKSSAVRALMHDVTAARKLE